MVTDSVTTIVEKLQERLAKLAGGGVAQINVGAATETEMKERKDLIDDALAATRAAMSKKAVVPGGGVASAPLCVSVLDDLKPERRPESSAVLRSGSKRSQKCRLRKIAENAGH